jgi:hypothetical protein
VTLIFSLGPLVAGSPWLMPASAAAAGGPIVSLPRWRGRVRKVGHAALAICS